MAKLHGTGGKWSLTQAERQMRRLMSAISIAVRVFGFGMGFTVGLFRTAVSLCVPYAALVRREFRTDPFAEPHACAKFTGFAPNPKTMLDFAPQTWLRYNTSDARCL